MQEADAAVESEVMRETTSSSPLRLNQLFFLGDTAVGKHAVLKMLAKSCFKAALPRSGAIEGAAQTALKPNSQLIKCIVKCGVK